MRLRYPIKTGQLAASLGDAIQNKGLHHFGVSLLYFYILFTEVFARHKKAPPKQGRLARAVYAGLALCGHMLDLLILGAAFILQFPQVENLLYPQPALGRGIPKRKGDRFISRNVRLGSSGANCHRSLMTALRSYFPPLTAPPARIMKS